MYKEGYGFRVGRTRSYHNNKMFSNDGRFGFMNRLNGEHADRIWILGAYENEGDSIFYENYYSCKYGMPTVVFQCRSKGDKFTQKHIDKLFKSLYDNDSKGRELLVDFGYNFDNPHHVPKSSRRSHAKNINICLCGDGRSENSIHRIEIGGSVDLDMKILNKNEISTQDNGKGTGWRIRRQSKDFSDIYSDVLKISVLVGGVIRPTALLKKGSKALDFTQASSLVKGMTLYVLGENGEIEYDIIESVEKETYTGCVYDINVENTHNFIANEVFTHNSIYSYSGANCKKIEELLTTRRKTDTFNLSVNFRSDINIIENSNKYSDLKATPHSKKDGDVDKGIIYTIDQLQDMLSGPGEIAMLVRTNAAIRKLELELLRRQVPMRYFNFITKADMKDFKSGKMRPQTQSKFNRVKKYFEGSENAVYAFIMASEDSKKFATSIHKSKGLEFDTCIVVNSISPDELEENGLMDKLTDKQFKKISFDPSDEGDKEANNIHYVAVSRSKHKLHFMVFDV